MKSAADKMTVEQFAQYAATHGSCELMHGEIRQLTPSGFEHGDITGRLHFYLAQHIIPNRLGKITVAETGFRFDEEQGPVVRAPDIAFVSAERVPEILPQSFATFAPDLIVETLSPTDAVSAVSEKIMWWMRHGVKEAWVADPANQTLTLHWPDGLSRRYGMNQPVDGSKVLSGLTIDLQQVFSS
ncbi:MAG: Uma2 family endonuclease [Planctomycetota bacterium]